MSQEKYIMAIDQGTTSSRAIIFNKKGEKMRTAVYCVSKNGYETCLKIRNSVYKNLHIYVSQRVANMLNLESENVENLFVINERVPILLEKTSVCVCAPMYICANTSIG